MKKSLLKPVSYIVCCAMAAGIAGTTAYALNEGSDGSADTQSETIPESTAEEKNDEVQKDETVYVLANEYGSANKVIVSDWLKNTAGSATLTESSILSDVENVKGDEDFTQSGDTRTWNAGGNDIYYRGTTTKELPVSMNITYTLDGREVSSTELIGKSGRLTIRFDYTNNVYEEREINGKTERIYVPFAVMTGFIADNEVFSDIEVTNGKIINDGNRTFVAGTAFPGIKDTLAADSDKINIPDYFEVTADVKNFSMGNTVSVISNEIFNNIDIDADSETDELTADIDKLSDAMNSICDGADALYDGLAQLYDKTNDLVDGVGQLHDGSKQLYEGLGQLNDSTAPLADGVTALTDGSKQLYDGLAQLNDKTAPLAEGVTALKDGSQQLYDGLGTLKEKTAPLSEGAAKLGSGSAQLESGAGDLSDGALQLSGGLDKLAANNDTLIAGAEQVFSSLLDIANAKLSEAGITGYTLTIDNYAKTLDAIAASLDEKAVAKLAEDTARKQVTAKVNENLTVIKAQVTEAVRAQVTEKVTAAVRENVFAAVLESQSLTPESYEQGVAAGMINEQTQAALTAAADAQMQTAEVQAQLKAAVDAQMQSEEITALIDSTTQQKADELIEENMKSAEVTAAIAEAKQKAAAGAPQIKALKDQLDSYNTFYTGLAQYTDGVAQAADGAKSLSDGAAQLKEGAAQLNGGISTLADSVPALTDGISQLYDGSGKINDGLDELSGNIPALTSGVGALYDGSKQIYDGLGELSDNIPALTDGVGALYDGSKQLYDGLSELDGNMPALTDGVTKLYDGSGELSDGCRQFSEEGVNKIVSIVDGDLGSILDRFDAMREVSGDYGTFSGGEGSTGSVKFIYRTDSIE